jgi:hypothetical protein
LDRSLIAKLKRVVADLRAQCDGVNVQGFDVISGLSGLGVYLLGRLGFGDAREALEEVVGCLIELSQEHDGLPRWHTPSRLSSPDDFMLRQFPNGYLNGGLAHGAPGLLGTLALVRLGGVDREGLGEAIGRLAAWLATHRADDEWGVNWPTGVGLSPEGDRGSGTAAPSAAPPAPTGWCYGSPGVARALYLAGIALRKPEYCELAVRAIEAVLRRPASSRRIPSPTFCHGVAGLLEIVLRFANDVPSETMRDGATALTRQLLALYEPQSLLGFRSVALGGVRVDQPGLLDGAPGVALVLIASAREVEPAWDRIFLLS